VVTDEVKLINKYKNKGSPELNQLSLTKVWSCLLTINEPLPCNPRSATLRGNSEGISLGPHFLCICL
jgi:hypothetical protein